MGHREIKEREREGGAEREKKIGSRGGEKGDIVGGR